MSGPTTFTLGSANAATCALSNLVQGIYVFSLTITDNSGATATDDLTVTVNPAPNQGPAANAGNNIVLTLPTNSTTLTGNGSDPDGTIASYAWSRVSGPTTFTLGSANTASTALSNLIFGTYTFRLTVTDNSGATATDDITVTVNAAPNQGPAANAGNNIVLTLPTNSTTLTGSGSDPDGTIATYTWSRVSGPTTFTLGSANAATCALSNLVQGIYVFSLTITDNSGETATDDLTVTVNPAPNQGPAANAGNNIVLTLPTNSTTLTGSGTDPDGTISSYIWSRVSGPTTFAFGSANTATTTLNNLVQGIYVFSLTVTDNSGATATDDLTVTVNAAPNQGPAANAGNNVVLTLPTNSTTLTGSGTDPDGTIASYAWSRVSGPTTFTLGSANTASTALSNLILGTYTFRLTVTDNSGATATDDITVTVNAAPNQGPAANAGNNIVLTLPTNSTTLTGSGTDPDGTISSYIWSRVSGPTTFAFGSANTATTTLNNLVQGTYIFSLTVTDDDGVTGTDDVTVTVNPAPNQGPAANAGNNIVLTLPTNSTTLTGSGSDPDGTIATYTWSRISGPTTFTLGSADAATTTLNNLVLGTYTFRLTVTDNSGATATDDLTVTVNPAPNQGPAANAGNNIVLTLPTNSTTLTGSGSDPDGTIATYTWSRVSGPTTFTLGSANAATCALSNLVQGIYVFSLTITDNSGATATDDLTVTVNPAPNQGPAANAGNNIVLTLPTNSTTLTGSGTDPDGAIASYTWSRISGPTTFTLGSANAASTTLSNLVQGTYTFRLTVADNSGATATDDLTVTVNPAPNQGPAANAGNNIVLTLPTNSATLTGSGSDPDGTIASYTWSRMSGPTTFTFGSANAATTTLNNLVQGIYVFSLKITDNSGATATDDLTVTVNPAPNQGPAANAGNNIVLTLPTNSTTLTGSGSDPDGTIASYTWSRISGPATFTIGSANAATTTLNNLVQGIYVFSLTVTDNSGATATDDITVTVNPAPNQGPAANAGNNIVLTLPTNSATLTGNGSDPDGTITSYTWSHINGPVSFTLGSANAATTTLNNLVQGTYTFRLTVTDNSGATATDDLTVTVNPAPNQGPAANAGNNIVLTLPTNSTTLTGSGSDPDGTIASYAWSRISGPTTFTLGSANAATTALSNLVQGTYIFSLTVTDDDGVTGTDDLTVIVNPAPNQGPAANAGNNIVLTLPTNSTTLTGSGNDPDGTIATYTWSRISGPTTFTLSNANTATTALSSLILGTYTFRLTVTDNSGATATDDLTVTVNPAPNQGPAANAGNNIVLTLPTNSTTLTGSGTDDDGTIASYTWSRVSGPTTFSFGSANAATTTLNNLVLGTYVFSLTVTDNSGATATDDITVTVNAAPNQGPAANAGNNIVLTLPTNSTTLTGSGTDPDGTIASYTWSRVSGPATFTLGSANAASTTLNNLVLGTYVFSLTVTDNSGATATDDITVTVNAAPNKGPAANAGNNIVLTLPINSTTLTGSGTDDDGTIASYTWSRVSGPTTFSFGSANAATTTLNNLVLGTYVFSLTVTDNSGATATDDLTVTVNAAPNQGPAANAGNNIVLTLPTNSTTLTGSGTDPDGTIASYAWSRVSGPTTFTLGSANAATTTLNNLALGTYVFSLTVTDNSGATATDDVTVTVNAAPNQIPAADAGSDLTITLPLNTVTLSGAGTDADGAVATYAWTKTAGPAAGSILSPGSASTSVTALVQGTYTFRLTVTDDDGALATDDIIVKVIAAPPPPNVRPFAEAGDDIKIYWPDNTVILNGENSGDADGSIVSWKWVLVSGPVSGSLSNSTSAKATFTGSVKGIYEFELTVTDDDGESSSDRILVTIIKNNQKPVIIIKDTLRVLLPVRNAELDASLSYDPDGIIKSITWTKVTGPSSFLFISPDSIKTIVTDLLPGVYVFRITVTDDDDDITTKLITVLVNHSSNRKLIPIINLFPNPASDKITITIDTEIEGRSEITFFNILGKPVMRGVFLKNSRIFNKTFDISNLASGPYAIKIVMERCETMVQKVIIQ